MLDPYLLGCLINFSFASDEDGVFDIYDQCTTLQQLYRINEMYKESLTDTPELVHSLQVSSKVFYGGLVNGFKCVYGMQIQKLPFLPYETATENWKYITGIIDMSSKLYVHDHCIFLDIFSSSEPLLKSLEKFIQIPATHTQDPSSGGYILSYQSTNVIDLFGYLVDSFKSCEFNHLLQHKKILPVCRVVRKDPNAVIPSKSRLSDVGYDLTVIRKHKDLNSTTALYDSGIALDIPFKYYVEVVPRSSLSKSGYALANSIGIIDPGYKGNIYVALTRTDPEAPDLSFPFRCCQLVFRKQVYVDLVESEKIGESVRNDGGYGSTG